MTGLLTMAAPAARNETFVSGWVWLALIGGVVALMLIDLFVGRKRGRMTTRNAAYQTGLWFALGAIVGTLILFEYGVQAGTEYYTAWLLEYSLSLDNVFAWSLILTQFAIQTQYRYRVIFWGIVGALVMRFLFIFLGVALLEKFAWMTLILAALLIISAIKLWRNRNVEPELSDSRAYRLFVRLVPTAPGRYGDKFVVRLKGKWRLTSLALCVLVVGAFDFLFAIDSIPAAFSVSQNLFVIFAANAMALLGLRSLFFLVEAWRDKFHWLDEGLIIILFFVAALLILGTELFGWHGYHPPVWGKLGFIVVVVVLSMTASWKWPKPDEQKHLQTVGYRSS